MLNGSIIISESCNARFIFRRLKYIPGNFVRSLSLRKNCLALDILKSVLCRNCSSFPLLPWWFYTSSFNTFYLLVFDWFFFLFIVLQSNDWTIRTDTCMNVMYIRCSRMIGVFRNSRQFFSLLIWSISEIFSLSPQAWLRDWLHNVMFGIRFCISMTSWADHE